MAAATGLVRQLLRLQGNTSTHRICGMGAGATAGFLGAAAVASASDGGAACSAYPWPQDGARGRQKVFMQHDCAACHSMLPYAAGLSEAGGQVEAKAAEIVVVHDYQAAQPETARPLHGGTYPPDLTLITKMLEGLRHNNLYTSEGLKKMMALPTPVWLQFLQPYMRTPQAG